MWPINPVLPADEGDTTLFAVIRFGESLGQLFDEGGASRTSGRQTLRMVKAALAGNLGENVGQPDAGNPATYKNEDGSTNLESDVTKATGAKTTTWIKGAP